MYNYGIITISLIKKLGEGVNMLKFLPNSSIPSNNQEREKIDKEDIERLDLWNAELQREAKSMESIPYIPAIVSADTFPISQKFSKYSSLPYGRIDTVGRVGCGPLAVEYALRILRQHYTFEEILEECVQKGYRAYIFDDSGNIIDGAGTEHSLFHNNAITLKGAQDLIKHLQAGHPITLLVNNTIYHNDEKRKGNHFVTLIGIDEDCNLIIMDGNLITDESNPTSALTKRNFWKMAAGIRCAWAWEA